MPLDESADPRIYDLRNALADANKRMAWLYKRLAILEAEIRMIHNNNASANALLEELRLHRAACDNSCCSCCRTAQP